MAAEVDIVRIKEITNLIFDHIINDLGMRSVSIDNAADFYWEVPKDCLFAVSNGQPKLDIGRLIDDKDFLMPLLNDKEQAVSFMFVHVAPLLRYIGEKIGQ